MRTPLALSSALCAAALLAASSLRAEPAAPGVFDVRSFGARGDGAADDTASINRAIDAAAADGGGTVAIAAGD
jgi:polygalacturonase